MKKLVYCSLMLMALAACNKNSTHEKDKVMNLAIIPPASVNEIKTNMVLNKQVAPDPSVKDTSKKIVKEGDISFEANNIMDTRKAIYNSLQKFGGYIAEENEANNSDNGRKQYNLKVRIPAKNFDQFVNGVAASAYKIDSKNIRVKDVTTQYIDITTQLANKKKLEGRYLELLKKGSKMADLLEIESKLNEIRTDIETTQGELNYLVKQVEYSSLDITFYTRQIAQDNGQTFGYKFKSALSDGWDILVNLFFGIIEVWPLWIIAVAFYFIFKAWRKKYPAKKTNQ